MKYRDKQKNAWTWLPSLYFAEGIPYVMVMTLSVIFYKRMGLSNTDIAIYTSWLYLPWIIKPLWSPFVDILKTKRWWIVIMQLLIGGGLAGIAFTIPLSHFFQYTLAFFWLLAFSSATHDIAADGFYLLALPKHKQAYFIGIRSTFYRLAMLTGQGLLVILAGYFEENIEQIIYKNQSNLNNIPLAWSIVFGIMSLFFLLFTLYHKFALPRPITDMQKKSDKNIVKEFFNTFVSFFKKKNITIALLFLLIYRLGESQLVKMASPFLLDTNEKNGLGLSTSQIGFVYGTVGIIALSLGGILGGIVVSRKGLKYWLFPMTLAMNIPNIVYVFLSYTLINDLWTVAQLVALEQFGYGFGFTAYMLYMVYISEGEFKTAHFSITTGFMALGMMLPGMLSGWLQEMMGYQNFFIWVMLCTIPGFLILPLLKIDPNFGKK